MVEVFERHASEVATAARTTKGLTSDEVLGVLRTDLQALGFEVERGKSAQDKLGRPVFFGENGVPTLRYEIDAYHAEWRAGLEVEAGRALMGNAVYRDLVQAMVMVDVDVLVLAVPNQYRFNGAGKPVVSPDYDRTVRIAGALYGHARIRMPYQLVVIGY